MVAVNLYFFIYWGVEMVKAKANKLLKNKYINKYCGKWIRKIAKFDWTFTKKSQQKLGNALLAIHKMEAEKKENVENTEKGEN